MSQEDPESFLLYGHIILSMVGGRHPMPAELLSLRIIKLWLRNCILSDPAQHASACELIKKVFSLLNSSFPSVISRDSWGFGGVEEAIITLEALLEDADHLEVLYESISQIRLQDALESLSRIVDSSFR